LTKPRDVNEAVPAGQDVDEGAELGDVDDSAAVDGTDVRRRRVEDQFDAAASLVDDGALLGADRDRAHYAVVVDVHVRAGLLLDRIDDLALRADDLSDLVDRDLEAHDLRGVLPDLGARLGNRSQHDLEHLEPRIAGL